MNSEEFKALKIGDIIVESVYKPGEKLREKYEYEVTTRYNADTIGIMPVISAAERRAKKKKRDGKILRCNSSELLYYQISHLK